VFEGSVPSTGVPVTFTDGITTQGSTTVQSQTNEFLSSDPGRAISGDGIPAGATVATFVSATQITISAPATSTNANAQITITRPLVLNDPISDIAVASDNSGYWLVGEDGGVFTFKSASSAMQFYGSLPGATDNFFPVAGNLPDYTTAVVDLLLWSGFYLNDGGATSNVFGIVENTGIWPQDSQGNAVVLDSTIFDKKPVIDAINTIKNVVGFLIYVGDTGEVHWHEANYWQSGNYLPDYSHTDFVPVIDERVQLTKYERQNPDKDLRSEIIVTDNDPFETPPGSTVVPSTLTTTYVPTTASELHGLIRPAMWVNSVFTNPSEQQAMVQLIALHIYFRSRLGSVTCIANPMIQVNDQVQILERQTFELNQHYVRGIRFIHDLDSGSYTMDLTTNILSPPGAWAVTKPPGAPGGSTLVAKI
jgi:hypothetical protein